MFGRYVANEICNKTMHQIWDSFVERRYFKFQDEIQFSSNTIETSWFGHHLWLQLLIKSCIILRAWHTMSCRYGM